LFDDGINTDAHGGAANLLEPLLEIGALQVVGGQAAAR